MPIHVMHLSKISAVTFCPTVMLKEFVLTIVEMYSINVMLMYLMIPPVV